MKPEAIVGSPAPSAVPDRVLTPTVQPKLNVGASVPFGKTKEVNIGFFTGFTFERVSALPPGRLPDDGEATLVRWTATGILGSNYSFLE